MQIAKFVLLGSSLLLLLSCPGGRLKTLEDYHMGNNVPFSALAKWKIKSFSFKASGKGFFALFPGKGVIFEESGTFGTSQIWLLLPKYLIIYDSANRTKREMSSLEDIGLKGFNPNELLMILSKEHDGTFSYRYKNAKITYTFNDSSISFDEIHISQGSFNFSISISNIHPIEPEIMERLLSNYESIILNGE